MLNACIFFVADRVLKLPPRVMDRMKTIAEDHEEYVAEHPEVKSPFGYLADVSISSGVGNGTYASLYRWLLVIAISGFFITFGWGTVKIMGLSRNGAQYKESKDAILFKMALLCLVFICLGLLSGVMAFWDGFLN